MALGQQHEGLAVGHGSLVFQATVLQGPGIQTGARVPGGQAEHIEVSQRVRRPIPVDAASRVAPCLAPIEHEAGCADQVAVPPVVDGAVVQKVVKEAPLGVVGGLLVEPQGVVHVSGQEVPVFKGGWWQ